MAKYIKLEDAKDAIRIPCENADSKEQKAIAQALYRLDDVPTIEASEDAISREYLEEQYWLGCHYQSRGKEQSDGGTR